MLWFLFVIAKKFIHVCLFFFAPVCAVLWCKISCFTRPSRLGYINNWIVSLISVNKVFNQWFWSVIQFLFADFQCSFIHILYHTLFSQFLAYPYHFRRYTNIISLIFPCYLRCLPEWYLKLPIDNIWELNSELCNDLFFPYLFCPVSGERPPYSCHVLTF